MATAGGLSTVSEHEEHVAVPAKQVEVKPRSKSMLPIVMQGLHRHSIIGYFCIVACIAVDVISAELLQYVEERGPYKKAMSLVWFNHSLMSIGIPVMAIVYNFQRKKAIASDKTNSMSTSQSLSRGAENRAKQKQPVVVTAGHVFAYIEGKTGFDMKDLLKVSMYFFLLVTAADICWYMSLATTPVFIALTIINMICMWTYILSVLVLGYAVVTEKVVSLVFCIVGVFLASAADISDVNSDYSTSELVLGALLCILSSMFYAVYSVLGKKLLGEKSDATLYVPSLISSFVGLGTLAFFTIPLLFFHFSGIEKLELPPKHVLPQFVIMAITTVAYNFVYMLAAVLANPLVLSIGLLTSIPISAVVDNVLWGTEIGVLGILGSLFVILGVCIMSHVEYKEEMARREDDLKAVVPPSLTLPSLPKEEVKGVKDYEIAL